MKWMGHMAQMGEKINEMDGPHGTNGRKEMKPHRRFMQIQEDNIKNYLN